MAKAQDKALGVVASRQCTSRPPNIEFSSIRELYLAFVEIFLSQGTILNSACGHSISVYAHHFFHMCKISADGHQGKLLMQHERETILSIAEGTGKYIIGENGSRARHLCSARETIADPDEVWEENPNVDAQWVYLKEYECLPYRFSVALLTEETAGGVIVPVSSFQCRKSDANRKWRKGKRIYSKNTTAAS